MIKYSFEPQSTAEMLSNSNRSPIEASGIYEPYLRNVFIVRDVNTLNNQHKFYDYGSYFREYSTKYDISSVQLRELPSQQIKMCYSFIKVSIYFNYRPLIINSVNPAVNSTHLNYLKN